MENASCKQNMNKTSYLTPFPLTPLEEGAVMTYRTSVMRDPARCHGQWKVVSRPDYYKQNPMESQVLKDILIAKKPSIF